ncbi:hypothetical protein F511_19544 [Dorcoceras hygrometricum]|uniref:Uncharacterized protein n=1 Tax=Dorcoceras hygrometricum TaxID=472368 RepID=A0A2Z7CZZ1_9LAMI|nr:hypothetical protein F511_19544 [Dorcoceras hygrometricum]
MRAVRNYQTSRELFVDSALARVSRDSQLWRELLSTRKLSTKLLLFTKPYLLRLPVVDVSAWSKTGSVEFHSLISFFPYRFWSRWLAGKVVALWLFECLCQVSPRELEEQLTYSASCWCSFFSCDLFENTIHSNLFMEVRISTSYISPSSTSEGSTRRFDLTTACTDPIPQPAAVRTPRLLKCTNSRSCVTDYIHKSFTSSCLDGSVNIFQDSFTNSCE